jgi:hypothetical protein
MTEFPSLESYSTFAQRVMANAKCVGEQTELLHGEHDEETKEFLQVVRETSTGRQKTLLRGSHLFRAQLAHDRRTCPVRIGFGNERTRSQ